LSVSPRPPACAVSPTAPLCASATISLDGLEPGGGRDLQFEPGTKWEYSDYGFVPLGVLIEKVSGKSYYNFVAENIYKVAGRTNSGSEPESVKVANRSRGFMRDRFEMVSNEPTLPWRGIGPPDEARTCGHGGGAPGMNAILRVSTPACHSSRT
jgi:CubicO group peptidase (beta-lactamase class C family)